MIKKLAIFSILLLTTFSTFSQKKEKIKGSRDVVNRITPVDPFDRLVFGENFKVTLIQGCDPSVEISADSNLHEIIDFAVLNGSLKFNTSKKIASNKALNIRVVYTNTLKAIELSDNSEISSVATLKIDTLKLSTSMSSKAFLTLQTNSFTYNTNGKSKSELNLMTDTANLRLSDNSTLEALINASTITIDLHQAADARIEGDTHDLNVFLDNSAKLNAENLSTKNCNLTVKEKADAKIEAIENLTIEAYGDTETIIYGEPKIALKDFQDNAVLIKKKKNKNKNG